MDEKHFYFMREALKEAYKAFFKGEVPVGTVAVLDDNIIAKAHNNVEKSKLFFSHAEFLLLQKINQYNKNYKFNNIIIYTTLEPCIMCTGALIQSRIKTVYYGASNIKSGFLNQLNLLKRDSNFNINISFHSGLLAKESEFLLKSFFLNLRKK
ncbi:tRNA-specific adenosine deaminase [Candidatus Phytoplasma luffae]|uniref:tRNA-specific adenosine deaminase n=1 Tax=Loofah witches'-broom phytoplasma TaxID=35773 RepID=A0A975FIR2_LOWBP|nr:nucleoside deaminase [Candidatus Phytoplasma luffae]QTX03225.1 tRNA-specific adenosine deaminase [Candidatus Phytoplasma luffae]